MMLIMVRRMNASLLAGRTTYFAGQGTRGMPRDAWTPTALSHTAS